MTPTEFNAGMAYLAAGVGKPVGSMQLEVYWDLLKALPADVFREALRRALLGLEDNFLPPAGVIYRHACDVQLKLRNQRETEQRRLRDDREALPATDVRRLLSGIGRLPGPKE